MNFKKNAYLKSRECELSIKTLIIIRYTGVIRKLDIITTMQRQDISKVYNNINSKEVMKHKYDADIATDVA